MEIYQFHNKHSNKSFHVLHHIQNNMFCDLCGIVKRIAVERRYFMTANQIAFNKMLEDVRHNQASEEIERMKARSAETSASAAASQARTALARQIEDARHNLADEGVRRGTLEVAQGQLAETTRSNTAREQIQTGDLAESIRHNAVMESETMRHNKESEIAAGRQASASMAQAAASQTQASAAARRQMEDARHNLVSESLTKQSVDTEAKRQTAQAANLQSQNYRNYQEGGVADSEKFRNYTTPFVSALTGLGRAILGGG